MENEDRKINKLLDFTEDPTLAIFDELTEINESLETVIPMFEGVDLSKIDQIQGEKGEKGDKGDKGDDGKDGRDGKDGKDGLKGLDGLDGKDGKDGNNGKDGLDGKDGSPDTGLQIKAKLLSLSEKDRLKLKDLGGFEQLIADIERFGVSRRSNIPQSGITTTFFSLNGTTIGRAKNINFITGATLDVTLAGDTATITIPTAGGGGTVTSVDASGGTTGLTFSGGPITSSGVLTLAGTLGVENGGTGVNTITGIIQGNGTSPFSAVTIGSGLTYSAGTLSVSASAVSPISLNTSGTGLYSSGLSGTQNGPANSIILGENAGSGATGALSSTFIGQLAGSGATNAASSNFFGSAAGQNAVSANNSNFYGVSAGTSATNAASSNFFGPSAGQSATNATFANFFGNSAGNGATGANNSNFFGSSAGQGATGALNSNIFGQIAGFGATNAAYSNLFGYNVGRTFTSNNIGANNIIIGKNISLPDATANAINLGGVLFGTGTYSTTAGNPSIVPISGGRIGIGVVSPVATLDVNGDTIISGSNRYLNFNTTSGTSGYGFRDNSGTMEFKDNAGSWLPLNSVSYWSRTAGILSPTTTTDGVSIAETGTGLTASMTGLSVSNSGMTYNTTAGALTDTRGSFIATSTRSAGANALTNRALYLEASGAQNNYPLITNGGFVGINLSTPLAPLHVQATAAAGTREQILRFSVSDAATDFGGWANGTVLDGTFATTFYGITNTDASRIPLVVDGFTTSTNDTGTIPLMAFQAIRTSSSTDPINGTFSSVVTRPLFSFRNNATSVLEILASGNTGIGVALPQTKLHISVDGSTATSLFYNTGDSVTINNNAAAATLRISSAATGGGSGNIILMGSNGTTTSPLVSGGGSTVGQVLGQATTSATTRLSIGTISFQTDSGFDGTTVGGRITFSTSISSGGASTEAMRINSSQNIGIGATTISARLHVVSTTEQLRVGYDASNYWNATTGTTGITTFDAVGSAHAFAFSDPVTINGNGTITGTTTLATSLTGILRADSGVVSVATGVGAKTLFDHYTDANNGTTVETDLYSDTLAAGQLANNGEKIIAQYGGTFVGDATSTQRLKMYFGGTLIFDTGALGIGASTSYWNMSVTCVRESSSIVRCTVALTTSFATLNAYSTYTKVTGLTLANTQVVKITGTAAGVTGASNQITASEGYVQWIPAS